MKGQERPLDKTWRTREPSRYLWKGHSGRGVVRKALGWACWKDCEEAPRHWSAVRRGWTETGGGGFCPKCVGGGLGVLASVCGHLSPGLCM